VTLPNVRPLPGSIVILIDEAAAVPSAFRTRFFAQLRVLFNQRARSHATDFVNRLSLLFSGTFRPERMIDDENSPFNVCLTLLTEDLNLDQARALASAAGHSEVEHLVERAYGLVGGQPYLLQSLLEAASQGTEEESRRELLEKRFQLLKRGDDGHVVYLLRRILAEPGSTELVPELVASVDGIPYAADGLHSFLRIVGLAAVRTVGPAERLVPRNELYRQVLVASPQFAATSPSTGPSVLVVEPPEAFSVLRDPVLRELAVDSYRGGVNAYSSADYRLALVAFGSAYEAILLDFLTHLDSGARNSACQQVTLPRGGGHPGGAPSGWSFATMIEVANATGQFRHARPQLSDLVRNWSNLVHPDNARRNYQRQEDLIPEVNMVVFVISKVLQGLK
jgi:hypothetical protein